MVQIFNYVSIFYTALVGNWHVRIPDDGHVLAETCCVIPVNT
jgi:hypothetical protein